MKRLRWIVAWLLIASPLVTSPLYAVYVYDRLNRALWGVDINGGGLLAVVILGLTGVLLLPVRPLIRLMSVPGYLLALFLMAVPWIANAICGYHGACL